MKTKHVLIDNKNPNHPIAVFDSKEDSKQMCAVFNSGKIIEVPYITEEYKYSVGISSESAKYRMRNPPAPTSLTLSVL